MFSGAGVSGNGQRELAEAIVGLQRPSAGTITVNGVNTTGGEPAAARRAGLSYVPEERMRDGAIGDFTVWENTVLLAHGQPPYSSRSVRRMTAIRRHAAELVSTYAVKTPDIGTHVRTLSGGNIQKLVMARELTATGGDVLVAQPTRRVDIGAAECIDERVIAARAAGLAVPLISEDATSCSG